MDIEICELMNKNIYNGADMPFLPPGPKLFPRHKSNETLTGDYTLPEFANV